MPSRYHPIEDGLWDDPKFDPQGKLLEARGDERGFFAFLASNKMQRPAGIYRATDAELACAYRMQERWVSRMIASLSSRGLLVRDGAWIFLPGYFKRQAHNPGMVKAAVSAVQSCSSYLVVSSFNKHYPLLAQRLPNGCPTVEEPSREITPAEQSSYRAVTEQSNNTSPRSEESWPSPRLLIAKYNKEAPDECPAVKSISPGRLKKAKAYLEIFPGEQWWTETFRQFHLSRYLRGLTNGSAQFPAVPRDLDWLLSKGHDQSENAVKVHDGRYRD